MKLEIEIKNYHEAGLEWCSAYVKDQKGDTIGKATGPVGGSTFDMQDAVIRAAVEEALSGLKVGSENKAVAKI